MPLPALVQAYVRQAQPPTSVRPPDSRRARPLRVRNEIPELSNRNNRAVKKDNIDDSNVLGNFGVTMKPNLAAPAVNPVLSSTTVLGSKNVQDESEQHDTMVKILSARLLHIRAARAMYAEDPDSAVLYLTKTNDVTLAVDIVPPLMRGLRTHASIGSTSSSPQRTISMAACFELLPILRQLLQSPFEDYKVVALDAIHMIVSKWKTRFQEVAQAVDQGGRASLEKSVSEKGLYIALVALKGDIFKIVTEIPGSDVSKKAEMVVRQLDFL